MTVRIRNHLIAQYFPELDPYFSYCGRACHRPLVPRSQGIECPVFPRVQPDGPVEERGQTGKGSASERSTGKAASSIGCAVLPSVSYEAGLLINAVRQVRDDDR